MNIADFITTYEGAVRVGAFALVFTGMAVWELAVPARAWTLPRSRRWTSNMLLSALSALIVRLIFPAAALGIAVVAEQHGAGLLRLSTLPGWLAVVLAVLLLDLAIYFQHRMFHALPVLWRLHRVHHADPEFDLTTGLRFHPFEILLSALIKVAAIFAIGPPLLAVLIFETALNVGSVFNHANVRLPAPFERAVRWLVVTPDMHRVHHSRDMRETNRNFGFNLSIWDRLFATYLAQPRLGHAGMRIGVDGFDDERVTTGFFGMLLMPFAREPRVDTHKASSGRTDHP